MHLTQIHGKPFITHPKLDQIARKLFQKKRQQYITICNMQALSVGGSFSSFSRDTTYTRCHSKDDRCSAVLWTPFLPGQRDALPLPLNNHRDHLLLIVTTSRRRCGSRCKCKLNSAGRIWICICSCSSIPRYYVKSQRVHNELRCENTFLHYSRKWTTRRIKG